MADIPVVFSGYTHWTDVTEPTLIANDGHSDYEVCVRLIELLSDDYDPQGFNIVRKAQAYITVTYKGYDVLRVKWTDKAKWVQVDRSNVLDLKNSGKFRPGATPYWALTPDTFEGVLNEIDTIKIAIGK